MRALIQRVSQASVTVDGEVLGRIGTGLVVLVGISGDDDQSKIDYVVSKTVNLRVFADEEGRFNLSAIDVGAELLVISQFTLYADTRRGRRPSFSRAAGPEEASRLFECALRSFRDTGLGVRTGRFQAHMDVAIHNDGPVTIMIDSDDQARPRRSS